MDRFRAENNNNEVTLTLGNLYKQDLPTANILPVYPSSFNEKFHFKNEKKYRIFNIPKTSNDSKRFLVPLRCCCIAGNDLPILVHRLPVSEFLSAHWRKWLLQFPEPVVKTIEEGIAEERPLITLFPLEKIPTEKHAVDPEMHYHILEKSAIPETGAPYPKYFTDTDIKEDKLVFPCMIKINQSLSGFGNYVTRNREEFSDILKMVKTRFGADVKYVTTEFIQDVRSTLDCGFYVTKAGHIIWLGVQECILEDYGYVAGTIDWDLQEQYKQRLYNKFVVPVAEYLHKKGYFGVVGIDIVSSPIGDYLVDLNPRINGDTPFLVLAAGMAKDGLSKSIFKISETFDTTGEQLVKKADLINERNTGKIVIMASIDESKKCNATVAVFDVSMEMAKSLYVRLFDKE